LIASLPTKEACGGMAKGGTWLIGIAPLNMQGLVGLLGRLLAM
jgi:hypothetical protein